MPDDDRSRWNLHIREPNGAVQVSIFDAARPTVERVLIDYLFEHPRHWPPQAEDGPTVYLEPSR